MVVCNDSIDFGWYIIMSTYNLTFYMTDCMTVVCCTNRGADAVQFWSVRNVISFTLF